MEKDLLILKEEKESIFSKIKNFFKNLFNKSSKQEISTEENSKKAAKEDFKDEIKIKDINSLENITTKEDLIKRIEENQELIYELSNERLDQLIDYYEKEIERKLEILKNYIAD